MDAQTTCPNCGAPVSRAICQYCGTQVVPNLSLDEQKQALDIYHGLLAAKNRPEQLNLLRSGFLPDAPEVLVEAGLRCVPLMEDTTDSKLNEAAAARLRAIVLKLKLGGQASSAATTISSAVTEFEKQIEQQQKLSSYRALAGLAILVGGIILVTAIVALIVMLLS